MPAAEPATPVVITPADPVPLSHLSLDVDEPSVGWLIELDRRHIDVLVDDVGREAVSRDDARMLITEHRARREAAEARRRAVREEQERQAIAADQAFRAALPKGLPWYEIPMGATAGEMWQAAELATQPKRESVLQHALSNSGEVEYHSLAPVADES